LVDERDLEAGLLRQEQAGVGQRQVEGRVVEVEVEGAEEGMGWRVEGLGEVGCVGFWVGWEACNSVVVDFLKTHINLYTHNVAIAAPTTTPTTTFSTVLSPRTIPLITATPSIPVQKPIADVIPLPHPFLPMQPTHPPQRTLIRLPRLHPGPHLQNRHPTKRPNPPTGRRAACGRPRRHEVRLSGHELSDGV
jgi:hypothetical protein